MGHFHWRIFGHFLLPSTMYWDFALAVKKSHVAVVIKSDKHVANHQTKWASFFAAAHHQNLLHFNQRKVKENKISAVESHQNVRLSMSPSSHPTVSYSGQNVIAVNLSAAIQTLLSFCTRVAASGISGSERVF